MIIWSGWGIVVPLFAVLGFVLGVAVGSSIVPGQWGPLVGMTLGGLASGVAVFFVARALDRREGRVLLDERTGQRILLKPSAGSFFFIPTRFWAYALPVAGIAFGLLVSTSASA